MTARQNGSGGMMGGSPTFDITGGWSEIDCLMSTPTLPQNWHPIGENAWSYRESA